MRISKKGGKYQEVSPFPAGDHRAAMNRRESSFILLCWAWYMYMYLLFSLSLGLPPHFVYFVIVGSDESEQMHKLTWAIAAHDPDSFARGGPTPTTFVLLIRGY